MSKHITQTKSQAAALRLEIYQRHCSGQSQQAIADALGMRQSNVCYHITKARAAIQCEIAHRRSDRLRELDRVRNEAWLAWEQDQTVQGAAFLNQVQQAIKQERGMLGLDAVKHLKAEVTFDELPHDTEDIAIGGQ